MRIKTNMTREELSWVLYDVANSAFVLVMVTAIMPIYFKDVAAGHLPGAVSTSNWGFANSTASLILAICSPVLGALADYNRRKSFFLSFLFLGLFFTFALSIIGAHQWILCLTFFIFARVGWAGANIFYDAFIVDVTPKEKMDALSSRGYAFGYIGSVIPFLLVIGLIFSAGQSASLPVNETRIGFIIVGLWWFILSIPAMRNFKQKHSIETPSQPVSDSFKRLWHTLLEIKQHQQAFLFLAAYFFYIDGVGTIISMSTVYGRDLGFDTTVLIGVLLFIQIVAFPFALLFGRLAHRFTLQKLLLSGIAVYCVATLLAFSLPSIENLTFKTLLFWCIAFLIASSMGGIQALSRSYFGKLIPPEKSGEFFGFYNIFGKFAAISGPFLMGIIARLTGETRWGVLSIMLLFIIGGFLLTKVHSSDIS
jgi:MFS transporter, UMF1 family